MNDNDNKYGNNMNNNDKNICFNSNFYQNWKG